MTLPAGQPSIEIAADSSRSGESLPFLHVDRLTVRFGDQTVLRELSFSLAQGHTLVILGESGCGKTTLLRAIAGLAASSGGDIRWDRQPLSTQPSQDRRIIYLDQEPLLFEHLNVADNIGFAPKLQRTPPATIRAEVAQMLEAIDLAGYERRRDWQLSGGQKQRVAFARAILARPKLLLLDEPFGSLDSQTRGQMQRLFHDLSERYALTSIFVTHDVKEALLVGDRLARMSAGNLIAYENQQAFIDDQATGVQREMDFWHGFSKP